MRALYNKYNYEQFKFCFNVTVGVGVGGYMPRTIPPSDATEGSVSIDPETGTVTPTEERGITLAPIIADQLEKLLTKADLIDANFATTTPLEEDGPITITPGPVPSPTPAPPTPTTAPPSPTQPPSPPHHDSGFCLIGHNPDGSCRGANVIKHSWKYAKCAAAIAALLTPGSKFFNAVKEVGGIYELIRMLQGGAATREDIGLETREILMRLLGVPAVVDTCGPAAHSVWQNLFGNGS